MWRGSQECSLGVMAAIHVGMGRAADDGELTAIVLEDLQIFRQLVIATRLCRNKILREESQTKIDRDEATLGFRLLTHEAR